MVDVILNYWYNMAMLGTLSIPFMDQIELFNCVETND